MNDRLDDYYVVRRANAQDAIHALRALDAFVRSPGGRVRLDGLDRVVVWRDDATLYLSPGALSLAGYLEPDPTVPRSPDLLGPEMTPSRTYAAPAMSPSGRIAATELPSACVLMLGHE